MISLVSAGYTIRWILAVRLTSSIRLTLSLSFLLFFSDDNPSSNLLQGALGSFPVAQGKKIYIIHLYT